MLVAEVVNSTRFYGNKEAELAWLGFAFTSESATMRIQLMRKIPFKMPENAQDVFSLTETDDDGETIWLGFEQKLTPQLKQESNRELVRGESQGAFEIGQAIGAEVSCLLTEVCC